MEQAKYKSTEHIEMFLMEHEHWTLTCDTNLEKLQLLYILFLTKASVNLISFHYHNLLFGCPQPEQSWKQYGCPQNARGSNDIVF